MTRTLEADGIRFTTRLPQELHQRLEAYAEASERSLAAAIRSLIRDHTPPVPPPSILDPSYPPHRYTLVWRHEDDHVIVTVAEIPIEGWHLPRFDQAARDIAEKLLHGLAGYPLAITHIPPDGADTVEAGP